MKIVAQIILCAVAYLVGSIPFGLLLSRLKGVDVRTVGSGNIGATNVFRSVSKSLGVLTFVLDFLKGFFPAWFFPMIGKALGPDFQSLENYNGLLYGTMAIAGHNWPIFLKFKGGKGISTSAGMLLGAAPGAVGVGLLTWVLLLLFTRTVSIASIGAAIAVPAAAWRFYGAQDWVKPAALTLLGLVAIWRHRSNIRRILNGTEHRFSLGKMPAQDQTAPDG
jgi:glycerol-3-phosphate acyltransferase PlsY